MNEIIRNVREMIQNNFIIEDDVMLSLKDDDNLIEKGVIDSFGILEIVHQIEETYGIRFLEEELTAENLSSVLAMAQFISRKHV